MLSAIVLEIENFQGWWNTIDFEVGNTNLNMDNIWICFFGAFFFFLYAQSCGAHATSPDSLPQRAKRAQVLHPITWWGRKTWENQNKVDMFAGS